MRQATAPPTIVACNATSADGEPGMEPTLKRLDDGDDRDEHEPGAAEERHAVGKELGFRAPAAREGTHVGWGPEGAHSSPGARLDVNSFDR